MSSIILQPSGNPNARQHYNDTIKNPVTVERIGKLLIKEGFHLKPFFFFKP